MSFFTNRAIIKIIPAKITITMTTTLQIYGTTIKYAYRDISSL